MIVTGGTDRFIQFWDASKKKPLVGKTIRMDRPVYSLSFDEPDGELMAVGMGDGLVAVYRWPTFLFQRRIADTKVEANGTLCGRICDVRFSNPLPAKLVGAAPGGGKLSGGAADVHHHDIGNFHPDRRGNGSRSGGGGSHSIVRGSGRQPTPSRYLACSCWDNKIYLLKIREVKVDEDLKTGEPKFDLEVKVHRVLVGNACTATHVMFCKTAGNPV